MTGVVTQGWGEQSVGVLSTLPADTNVLGWARMEASNPRGPASWSPATETSLLLPAFRDLAIPAQFKVQTLQQHRFEDLARWGFREPRFPVLPQKGPAG